MHVKIARLSILLHLLSFPVLFSQHVPANSIPHTRSLYRNLTFHGNHLVYQGKKVALGPHAFFIDGSLSDEVVEQYPYVFNTLQQAVKRLQNGTETQPMTLYFAPWVYWVDDPDDPEVRVPKEGSNTPFGMEIDCEWLRFYGLTSDPYQVILACNRGQTMGAKGNFTMFNIRGDGLSSENITFGNYCNLDLTYPANPELNRKKRGDAIVQAQLIFSNGDKVVARNTNFISRLNLGPFWGSKRTLFDRCHFESTDDALNGSAVYLNCTLDLYSSKPFGHTSGTGAVFLNCDFRVFTRGNQYLVKGPGPVSLVDCRFTGKQFSYLGWRDLPAEEARYYQHNIQSNGHPVFMDSIHPFATVDMNHKEVLSAYKLLHKEDTIYNTYNLLRGNDEWDPMHVKPRIAKAEKSQKKLSTARPTLLQLTPTRKYLETGKDSLLLQAKLFAHGNFPVEMEKVTWDIPEKHKDYVRLNVQPDGSCWLIPTNTQNETQPVLINAFTASGLEAAAVFTIAPRFLAPPDFLEEPQIRYQKSGKLQVNYRLDMDFEDQSVITWYRCKNANGEAPIKVAVSRFNIPMYSYTLSAADVGWYLMATVEPKHLRCNAGKSKIVLYTQKITAADIKKEDNPLHVNLRNLPGEYQPNVLPGFWAMDSYAPADTHEWYWEADNSRAPWYYGSGINGAAKDTGMVQNTKGARLRYQPVGTTFGDMEVQFTAVPAKTAGQGFSSARAQYMDIGIKMDVTTMSGYALRLIRTTKYGDAIDFVLMQYMNGEAHPISEPVSASCYRPNCRISLKITGSRFSVSASNLFDSYYSKHDTGQVKRHVLMEAEITPGTDGGVSFQHTGSVRSGATLIKDLSIYWK